MGGGAMGRWDGITELKAKKQQDQMRQGDLTESRRKMLGSCSRAVMVRERGRRGGDGSVGRTDDWWLWGRGELRMMSWQLTCPTV